MAVFERVQQTAQIERCRKGDAKNWNHCYEMAGVASGIAYLKIFSAKGLVGDCALVKAYDFFADASRGEEIYAEILKRGKRLLPILEYALNNKPCIPKVGDKDLAENLCLTSKTYTEDIRRFMKDIEAGKKPDPGLE